VVDATHSVADVDTKKDKERQRVEVVNSRPNDTTHVHLDVVHETSLEWFQNRL
jgi:hypothetical protein